MAIRSVEKLDQIKVHFSKAVFRHRLLHWYQSNGRSLPWREDWIKYKNPYHIWLSEIMLQQTVIKAVIPVYKRFLDKLPTLQDLALADDDTVRELVRGLGYYRRFSFFKKAAEQLSSEANTTWPATAEEWLTLPGVGPYTAAAVASIAFNDQAAVLDGNVERVLCRLLNIQLPPNLPQLKKRFQTIVNELLDEHSPGDFNQGIMELGQRVCTPTRPTCETCPVSECCLAFAKNTQIIAPQPKTKTAKINVNLNLLIVKQGSHTVLFQRPDSAKFLKESWGFITISLKEDTLIGDGFSLGKDILGSAEKLGSFKHNITNHKISASVWMLDIKSNQLSFGIKTKGKKVKDQLIEKSLISNLDRKAWKIYSHAYSNIT